MTIQEILEAHTFGHSLLTVRGFCDGCDWHSYTGPKVAIEAHRAHLGEVLDKHMQEREYRAWSNGFHKGRKTENGSHIRTWPKNPYRKETTNGR